MVEQWMSDLPIGGMAIVAFTLIILSYIKSVGAYRKNEELQNSMNKDKTFQSCASQLAPYMVNNIKVKTELINDLKEQSSANREASEKQQEAVQGLIIAVNSLVVLTKETLDRVKYIEREGGRSK